MKAKWDTMQGYVMHLDGKSDKEIADHFGVAVNTVAYCRKRNWEKLAPPPAEAGAELKEEIPVVEVPAPPVPEAPAPAVPERPSADRYAFLAEATRELQGIDAICTAEALLSLWNWRDKAALLKAREAIDYLITKSG